ncbi:MAG TPA: TraB/GumN family protein [Caulobacteraceae bacterium]|nr:TraB/GumN family protein [Caulobacteraceae bacterium]
MPTLRTLAALAAGLLWAGAAWAQPPVWVVRHGAATVTLFGSVHLLPPGLDWRPPALTTALAHADEVWFELPIDDATAAKAQRLARRSGALPRGDALDKHLNAPARARLARLAPSLGLPLQALQPMRPWQAEVVLSLADTARYGASAADGVERQVAAELPSSMRRRAFETASQQIAFLADMPMAEQSASLEQTLAEDEAEPNLYEAIVRDWLAGDLPALEREALDPIRRQTPAVYERLIAARNRRWAATLSRRLSGRRAIVVIVGMDHMLGSDGLPALLRRRGFSVEGPSADAGDGSPQESGGSR